MIEPLAASSKALGEIRELIPSLNLDDDKARDINTRLQRVANTIEENKSKIWLRTRAGKEMVEMIEEAVDKLLEVIKFDSDGEKFFMALKVLETEATRIDDETRRRSMVVT